MTQMSIAPTECVWYVLLESMHLGQLSTSFSIAVLKVIIYVSNEHRSTNALILCNEILNRSAKLKACKYFKKAGDGNGILLDDNCSN